MVKNRYKKSFGDFLYFSETCIFIQNKELLPTSISFPKFIVLIICLSTLQLHNGIRSGWHVDGHIASLLVVSNTENIAS